MKYHRFISIFLGSSMLVFGFLKFFYPFKGWYAAQISASKLGSSSYVMGIAGELIIGMVLVCSVVMSNRFSRVRYATISALASFGVVVMMLTGAYVHLHPDVPATVLPLKIKPPYIPLSFLAAALFNIIFVLYHYRYQKGGLSTD